MDFVIITGLSGAGKSRTIDALEDIGFYCVDNMPPKLISKFAEICTQSHGAIEKIAVVTDVRGGELFQGLFEELDYLEDKGFNYKLLFLDANDNVLMRRYKETRRRHPLLDMVDGSIENAIKTERMLLKPAMERADYIIDSSLLSSAQLRDRITSIFLDKIDNKMLINCMSFGFKYGPATEADLLFDVRCLPNPFYIDELKKKTGLDPDVREYVMKWEQSRQLLQKIIDMIDFLIPLYINEGKTQLVVAFGCTGGKHRSVTFAEKVLRHLIENSHKATVNHRDIIKN